VLAICTRAVVVIMTPAAAGRYQMSHFVPLAVRMALAAWLGIPPRRAESLQEALGRVCSAACWNAGCGKCVPCTPAPAPRAVKGLRMVNATIGPGNVPAIHIIDGGILRALLSFELFAKQLLLATSLIDRMHSAIASGHRFATKKLGYLFH